MNAKKSKQKTIRYFMCFFLLLTLSPTLPPIITPIKGAVDITIA